jgi:hypothetical protein
MKTILEHTFKTNVEVKKYGEIMTPIELVEEMLDTLPHTVWMNPNLKWLDPCNGVGTFISVVVQRLMKALEWTIPNEEERYKHIMENMIYVCELQPKNVFLYMYAFDPEDKYALNIYNGSYLTEGFNKHMLDLGVEKFDVIVMNPPYNDNNGARGTGNTLWDKFVIKTLNSLIDGGYLVAVHPDGWRSLGKGTFNEVKKELKSRQMLYLEIHNKYEGMKTFGASTTYDFYCVQNVPCTVNTKIRCNDGSIERADISKMDYIPNGMFSSFKKLLPKKHEKAVSVLHSESNYAHRKPYMSKIQTEEYKYPVVYLTYKDGSLKFMYSSINTQGHFGVPKVIWSNGISMPIVDINGEYGMSEYCSAIVDIPENLERIKTAMLNPDFIKLMSFSDGVTGTGHRYNRKVIAMFRKDFWMEFIIFKENGGEHENNIKMAQDRITKRTDRPQ